VITGFTAFDQLDTDLPVLEDITLTEPEKTDLQKEARLPSLYCQGCRKCIGQCPERLPIPDLMRAYMYTYAYRNAAHAQDLVLSLGLPSGVCGDCGECPVRCPEGFNVRRKIRDVARLKDVPPEFLG
jgi:uncharacterized protein